MKNLPLTRNGKVDRRALPPPDVGAGVSRDYQPPEGPVEESLATLWQELLQVDRVGRNDNFFELGGHSLLALKVLSRMNQRFGCSLRGVDAYQSPTLEQLARRVADGGGADQRINLKAEAMLPEVITPIPGRVKAPAEVVLLTGGTGFVGRFLLAELLEHTNAQIYCLVRTESQDTALFNIKTALSRSHLWRDAFLNRIVAVSGDISKARLGLESRTYLALCHDVDSIYHCATSMNHLETYEMAKPTTVNGAKELLKIAVTSKPKLMNYISSLGVFTNTQADGMRVVDEVTPIDCEEHWNSHGYAASKWVAEKIFMTAQARGINCHIFRLGLVWADMQSGRYDDLQRNYRIIKSCLLSGFGIKDYIFEMVPTAVDYVARSIVYLSTQKSEGGGIFHICAKEQKIKGLFESCNEVCGTNLRLVPYYDWIRNVKRLHQDGVVLPAVPLVEASFELTREEFDCAQTQNRFRRIRFASAKTHEELERGGIFAPCFDDERVRLCLARMVSTDPDLVRAGVAKVCR
jgi:thioester reductase-like protein